MTANILGMIGTNAANVGIDNDLIETHKLSLSEKNEHLLRK